MRRATCAPQVGSRGYARMGVSGPIWLVSWTPGVQGRRCVARLVRRPLSARRARHGEALDAGRRRSDAARQDGRRGAGHLEPTVRQVPRDRGEARHLIERLPRGAQAHAGRHRPASPGRQACPRVCALSAGHEPTRAHACKVHASRKKEESPTPSPDPSPTPSGPTPSRRHEPVVPAAPPVGASALALALAIALPDAENPASNVLSADHLARILGGLLYAATSAVPWALLLRRTFDADISTCARCGGRVRVRAVVTDHAVAAKILAAIDAGRARAPPPPPAAA